MRVAIVHDDLVQWGGAERVLTGLCEIFPNAPIYTSLFDKNNFVLKRNFGTKEVITSFLQKIPGWKSLYKTLLPLYPLAFEQFDFSQYDLVISHTTRFAKSIITKPQTLHICYIHTPPRFLWRFSGDKSYGAGELILSNLRVYDMVAARRVDYFIAGSQNAQRRIKKIYNAQAKVVYPFIDLSRFNQVESFNGGYYLVISRGSGYKRIDLAIQTCLSSGWPLKVVGNNLINSVDKIDGRPNCIEFLGVLDDQLLVQVIAGCKALIIPGIEDFGLTSLEAQALGKPVIALRDGGVLETVIEGKTGLFFNEQTEDSLKEALLQLHSVKISPEDCINNAKNFSKERFAKNFSAVVDSLLYTK